MSNSNNTDITNFTLVRKITVGVGSGAVDTNINGQFNDLLDVSISTATHNQIAIFDSDTQIWKLGELDDNAFTFTSGFGNDPTTIGLSPQTGYGDSDWGVSLALRTTDDLVEGATNLYFTNTIANQNFNQNFNQKTTADLTEQTNLYYTSTRFDTDFNIRSTTNLSEGVNLYYTSTRFDTDFNIRSTTNLSEGVNFYYTESRFNASFASALTTDLSEGSNLYYTTTRFDSDFAVAQSSLVATDSNQSVLIQNNADAISNLQVADLNQDSALSAVTVRLNGIDSDQQTLDSAVGDILTNVGNLANADIALIADVARLDSEQGVQNTSITSLIAADSDHDSAIAANTQAIIDINNAPGFDDSALRAADIALIADVARLDSEQGVQNTSITSLIAADSAINGSLLSVDGVLTQVGIDQAAQDSAIAANTQEIININASRYDDSALVADITRLDIEQGSQDSAIAANALGLANNDSDIADLVLADNALIAADSNLNAAILLNDSDISSLYTTIGIINARDSNQSVLIQNNDADIELLYATDSNLDSAISVNALGITNNDSDILDLVIADNALIAVDSNQTLLIAANTQAIANNDSDILALDIVDNALIAVDSDQSLLIAANTQAITNNDSDILALGIVDSNLGELITALQATVDAGVDATTATITVPAHPFAVGQAIGYNNGSWIPAKADSADTLALGVVIEVVDQNTVKYALAGRFNITHGLAVDTWFYLSDTVLGGLTTTAPTIEQLVAVTDDSDHISIYPYRPFTQVTYSTNPNNALIADLIARVDALENP